MTSRKWLECVIEFELLGDGWSQFKSGDTLFYTRIDSDNVHGPFKVIDPDKRIIANTSGIEMEASWIGNGWVLAKPVM